MLTLLASAAGLSPAGSDAAADTWWPALTEVWPAFDEHYRATGERAVFALEPEAGDVVG